tara:strand:- start:158 stop:670 length:513 start_codon:yes stop_codon:yes gene_type:complete
MMTEKIPKKIFLIITFIASTFSIAQAETLISLESFKIKPDTNLELTSESMSFDAQTRKAHFIENVVVKYGQLELSAHQLTFVQSKSKEKLYHLTFSALGPIIISNEDSRIYGDKAIFIEKNQELTITGNVSLNKNDNTIMGDKLILNLETGVANVSGSVKTIINPSRENQ